MGIRLVLVAIALTIGTSTTLLAGPLEDGESAYKRKDYAAAVELWRPLAEHGDPVAQDHLGGMYALGLGVAPNLETAMEWYRLSAAQEYPDAQDSLAFAYEYGRGVERNITKAMYWRTKAANHGLPSAQLALGIGYMRGNHVSADHVLAFKWLDLAAKKSSEIGLIQDFAIRYRDQLEKIMTPEELARARELIRMWHQD